ARAADGQIPGHAEQVAEDALDQERLGEADHPLEPQDRLLAGQTDVLRPALAGVAEPPTDHPDRVATPDLGHDDPAGQQLAQRAATAVLPERAPQEPQLLGDVERVLAAEDALQ